MVNVIELVPLAGWKAMSVLFFCLAIGTFALGTLKIWKIRKRAMKTRG